MLIRSDAHIEDETAISSDDQCEDPTSDMEKVEHAKALIPADVGMVASLFRLLSDETRCKIVATLVGGELCVHEIAQAVGSSLSNVSHHLRLLRAGRLVKYRKHQRRVFYSLDDDHVTTLISQVLEHMSHK